MNVQDSFNMDKCHQFVAKPDSVLRGDSKIYYEFGVYDFTIYIGKSVIYAGHGQIESFHIRDNKLKLNNILIGSSRAFFEKKLKLNFPNKNKIECIEGDGAYVSFQLDNNKIVAIDYFCPPL